MLHQSFVPETFSTCCSSCGRPFDGNEELQYRPDEYSLVYKGKLIRFTQIQGDMFNTLWSRKGSIVTKESLHILTYNLRLDGGPEPKTMDVHICRIRKLLKTYEFPVYIETIHSVGWRLIVTCD